MKKTNYFLIILILSDNEGNTIPNLYWIIGFLVLILLTSFYIFWFRSNLYRIKKDDTIESIAANKNIAIPILIYLNPTLKNLSVTENIDSYNKKLKIPRLFQKTILYYYFNSDDKERIASDFSISENKIHCSKKNIFRFKIPVNYESLNLESIKKQDKGATIPITSAQLVDIVKDIAELKSKVAYWIEEEKQKKQEINSFKSEEINELEYEISSLKKEKERIRERVYLFPNKEEFESLITNNLVIFNKISSIEGQVKEKLNLFKKNEIQSKSQKIFSQIIEKYYSNKPFSQFEYWKNCIQNKIVTDKKLVKELNLSNPRDQLSILKRELYKEVYIKTFSGVIILLSELSKFSVISGLQNSEIENLEKIASVELNEFISVLKQRVHYYPVAVELFSNRKNIQLKIEMDDTISISNYLKNIELEPDTIREIIRVGFDIKDSDIGYTGDTNVTKFKNA